MAGLDTLGATHSMVKALNPIRKLLARTLLCWVQLWLLSIRWPRRGRPEHPQHTGDERRHQPKGYVFLGRRRFHV